MNQIDITLKRVAYIGVTRKSSSNKSKSIIDIGEKNRMDWA